MPASLVTWEVTPEWTIGTASPASATYENDLLYAIKSCLDAYVAANPSCPWVVASSDFVSTGYRTLVLKRADGSPGRIMWFYCVSDIADGVAAVNVTSTDSDGFVGYAPEATTDTPADISAGLPWPAWCRGRPTGGTNTGPAIGDVLRLLISPAGVLLVVHGSSDTALHLAGAGDLALGPDGEAYPCAYGNGVSTNSTSNWAATSPTASSNYIPFASDAVVNATVGAGGVYVNGLDHLCRRSVAVNCLDLLDVNTQRRQFVPFIFSGPAVIGYPWKLRQIAYGIHGAMGEQMLEAGGTGAVMAIAMSPRRGITPNAFDTLWATNFAV